MSTRSRSDVIVGMAILLVCPIVAVLAVLGGKYATVGVAGVIALAVGAYVGLRHPLWLFWGLAVVLGALPFGYLPGVHVPLVLMFATAAVLAAVVLRTEAPRRHPLEITLILLAAVSGLSVIVTGRQIGDYVEFVKWTIATLLVLVLLTLYQDQLRRFGQVFACAAALNGLFGVANIAKPSLINVLSPFGYGKVTGERFVYTDEGTAQSVRLGGTWVDPNAAGIALLVALCVSLVVFVGWQRVCLTTTIVLTLVLTLSRSAILSVAAGVILVLLFHPMAKKFRSQMLAVLGLAVVAAALTPAVRNRLLMSFTSGGDFATRARGDAIAEYPHLMAGHWTFGLGWNRPEFTNGSLAFTMNHVSNAPLLTVYRGGVITGILFVAVLVVGAVYGWRAIRSNSMPAALYGGIYIGFVVIALNLDHPVVAVPPITTTFSVLLAFLVYADRQRRSDRDDLRIGRATEPSGAQAATLTA